MSDLNPYEEGLAVDLAKAQARIKELCVLHREYEKLLSERIEELSNCVAVLEADLRKMALDYLAAQGQAADAYEAQLAAEAKAMKASNAALLEKRRADEAQAKLSKSEALLAKAVGQMQRVKDYRYDPNIGIELNRLEEALAELNYDERSEKKGEDRG
jgi:hypothetical protein